LRKVVNKQTDKQTNNDENISLPNVKTLEEWLTHKLMTKQQTKVTFLLLCNQAEYRSINIAPRH